MTPDLWKPFGGLMLIILIALSGSAPALAQDAADAEPAAATDTAADTDIAAGTDGMVEGSAIDAFTNRWNQGGNTMWALAFVALLGVGFIIERFISLTRGRIAPRGLATKANDLWKQGDIDGVIKLGDSSNSTLGKVIAFVAEHRDAPYEHLVSGAEDMALREFEVHTRRNHVLSSIGAVSPLLGLMGTVFGLMGAFASIGAIGTMDDPSVLADDIGKAMVTTAAGLIIAVPALGLYFYFRSRTGQLASIVGEEVSALMHAWFLKKKA